MIIEDTAEIDLFDAALIRTSSRGRSGCRTTRARAAISQGELVKHALRYRPDWLVAGEVRDSDAAVPMLKAMTHGQSSLTTVHAHSALGGLDKLALYLGTGEDRLPIDAAHHQLSQAIDFVVHVDRWPDGRRFVSEVVEVAGFDNGRCTTNTIYTARAARAGHTMQRLTHGCTPSSCRAAGFDVAELGGAGGEAWR